MLGLLPFFNDVPSLLVLSASLVALNIGVTEMASKFILVQLYLLISRFANPTAFSNFCLAALRLSDAYLIPSCSKRPSHPPSEPFG